MSGQSRIRAVWVLVILLTCLSFAGPWVFDRIMVPAEYTCSTPVYRLEGDFCGVPLSGLQVLFSFSLGTLQIIFDVVSGNYSIFEGFRELVFIFLIQLLLLPVLTTLAAGFNTGARWLQRFNLGAWVLVFLLLLSAGFFQPSELHPALWGAWLYRLLVVGVVAWQAAVILRRSTHPQTLIK